MPRKLRQNEDKSSTLAVAASPSNPHLIVPAENCKSVSDEIAALIQSIGQDHQACLSSSMSAVRHAIEAGQKLRAVRGFVGQGSWEKYFEEQITPSTGIRLRTGQRYAQIADEWDTFIATLPSGSDERKREFLDQNLIESFRVERSQKTAQLRADPNAWLTPKSIVQAAREVVGEISLDPTSILENGEPDSALYRDWQGNCWIAPGHHGELDQWIEKAMQELELGNMLAGLLMLPVTLVAQHSELHAYPFVIFTEPITVSAKRIKKRKDREPLVIWKDTILSTRMAIVYLAHSPALDRFEQAFRSLGSVFVPLKAGQAQARTTLVINAPTSLASNE